MEVKDEIFLKSVSRISHWSDSPPSITSQPLHPRAGGAGGAAGGCAGFAEAPQIYNFHNILLCFAFFAPLRWIHQFFRPQVIFTIINYIYLWTHGSVRKGVRNARHAKTAARHSLPSMWYAAVVFAARPRTSKCMSGSKYRSTRQELFSS